MRSGIDVLSDVPGNGSELQRHEWYGIRLKMGLHRGDPAHWAAPWGRSPASVEDNGTTLLTHVRTDPEQLSAGLFYGCEGMRVGGKRKLQIASHLAYPEQRVPSVVPAAALRVAGLEILSQDLPG